MEHTLKDFLQIAHIRHMSWMSDGDRLVYLSDESGLSQIYVVGIGSGALPQRLTDFREPVQFAACSPAHDQVAFGMARGGDERTQLYMLNVATRETAPLTNQPQVIHRWGGWSPDGEWVTYASNARTGDDFDVYVMNRVSGESRCVFAHGGWCDSLGFSSTGRYVIARVQHTLHSHDLFLIDTQQNDRVICITQHEGVAEYERPCWLPNDVAVLYTSSTDREYTALELYTLDTQKRRTLYAPQHDIMNLAVHPSGSTAVCVVNENGYMRLHHLDVSTGHTQLVFPEQHVTELLWSPTGDRLACIAEDTCTPSHLLLWHPDANETQRVGQGADLLPRHDCVEPRLMEFASFDSERIPLFVFEPRFNAPAGPAIVILHGGPESQFRAGFHPLVQYFVSQGYRVFAPNIRGSRGYGKRFLSLDDRDKRMDSVHDLASLHSFVVSNGLADPQRIALMGGSYGGYMTLAGLAFQPELWAAGVDSVGMSNLVSFLQHTASWRRSLREQEYGSLESDQELLRSLSPLYSIDRIRAPLFVIHGANDPRVPLAEAEQIAHALQQRGNVVELCVYANEGHGLHVFENRLDAYTRVTAFFNEHLRGLKA